MSQRLSRDAYAGVVGGGGHAARLELPPPRLPDDDPQPHFAFFGFFVRRPLPPATRFISSSVNILMSTSNM